MQRLRTAYAYDAHFARQGFRNETLRHLEVDAEITRDMVHVDDGYVGEGYGQPTPAMWEALQMAARSEGLLLDPVYTGKALAALLDHVRRAIVPQGATVVFPHTGGLPGLIAYGDEESRAVDVDWAGLAGV